MPIRTVIDLADVGHEPRQLVDMISAILRECLATRSEVIGSLAGGVQMLGRHFGSKDELESWSDERFSRSSHPGGADPASADRCSVGTDPGGNARVAGTAGPERDTGRPLPQDNRDTA